MRVFPFGLSDGEREETFTYYPHASLISGYYGDAEAERDVVRAFERNRERGEATSEAVLDEILDARMAGERIACRLRPLSAILREHGVERVDLLKIDVEKSERDVLAGIADEDWEKIRQVVIEVHDIDGRLAEVTALLRSRGFEVVAEQEASLAGTGIRRVYATRGPRPGASATPDAGTGTPARLVAELRRALAERLPEHMVPSAFQLDALPLTPSSKVDRRALPALDAAQPRPEASYVAPRTPLEATLVGIWAELLRVDRASVHDDFFALGAPLPARRAGALAGARPHGVRPAPARALRGADDRPARGASRRRRATTRAASPSALVRMRGGDPHRTPLFFVHGAGGSAHVFAELSESLGDRARSGRPGPRARRRPPSPALPWRRWRATTSPRSAASSRPAPTSSAAGRSAASSPSRWRGCWRRPESAWRCSCSWTPTPGPKVPRGLRRRPTWISRTRSAGSACSPTTSSCSAATSPDPTPALPCSCAPRRRRTERPRISAGPGGSREAS